MAIWILAIGWILYFALHSLLAASQVKKIVKDNAGRYYKYYRIFYVTFSSLGLLLLLMLNANISASPYFDSEGWPRYLSLVLAAFGVIIIKIAFRSFSFSSFVGFESADKEEEFTTAGILNSVRHPIYSGTILIVIGYWLFSPNFPTLVSVICIMAYLPIGIYLEERKLITQFGERYLKYKRSVPALFPRLF